MADVETPEEEVIEEPQVEEEIEAPETPEETPETPAEEPQDEEPPKPPSRRENLRIQALVERLRQKEEPKTPPAKTSDFDYRTDLEADPEVIARLEAERERRDRAQFEAGTSAGLQKAESIQFITRLEIDAPRIESKYPIMDPQGETFDPVVANAINQWYLATAGYDAENGSVRTAGVRYAEFVDGIMELADVLAGEKSQKSSQALVRQAAQTGIRPGGTATKGLNLNQSPEDMTDEELEAKIASVLPKR